MTHKPQQFGWDENCMPVWMEQDAAPTALLQAVHCKSCKTGCKSGRCACKKHGLKCTKLCKCTGCDNRDADSSGLEEDVVEELHTRAAMAAEAETVEANGDGDGSVEDSESPDQGTVFGVNDEVEHRVADEDGEEGDDEMEDEESDGGDFPTEEARMHVADGDDELDEAGEDGDDESESESEDVMYVD